MGKEQSFPVMNIRVYSFLKLRTFVQWLKAPLFNKTYGIKIFNN